MEILLSILAGLVIVVWTIRPLYNFFQKNKYVLLAENKNTLNNRVKSGLPAIAFLFIVLALLIVPAIMKNIVDGTTTGSVIVLEIIIIYILTRVDKRQTKYKVKSLGLEFKKRFISWDEMSVRYKKTWLIILYKPRFIVRSNNTKIIVPLLSRQINEFSKEVLEHNKSVGLLVKSIINNGRDYYVTNKELAKKLDKKK